MIDYGARIERNHVIRGRIKYYLRLHLVCVYFRAQVYHFLIEILTNKQ